MNKLKGKIFELVMLILWIIYLVLAIVIKDFIMIPIIAYMIAYYINNIYRHIQYQRKE